jgi:hypothetical protein
MAIGRMGQDRRLFLGPRVAKSWRAAAAHQTPSGTQVGRWAMTWALVSVGHQPGPDRAAVGQNDVQYVCGVLHP